MQLLEVRGLSSSRKNSLNRQVRAGGSIKEKGLKYPKYPEISTSIRQKKVMRCVAFCTLKRYETPRRYILGSGYSNYMLMWVQFPLPPPLRGDSLTW
jgi:hypothetical protein